jgi:hypothetical protein
MDWRLPEDQIAVRLDALSVYVRQLERAPLHTRKFLAAVTQRIVRAASTPSVYADDFSYSIDMDHLRASLFGATGKLMSKRVIEELACDLWTYGLGDVDEHRDSPTKAVVKIFHAGRWPLWTELIAYAAEIGLPFEAFYRDLNFSSLGQ